MMVEGQREAFRDVVRQFLAERLGLESLPKDALIDLEVTLHTAEGRKVSQPTTATLMNHEIVDNPLVFKFTEHVQLIQGSYLRFRVPANDAPGYLVLCPEYGWLNLSPSDTLSITFDAVCQPTFDQKKSVFW